MNFHLTQVMSGHRAFNAYLFCVKLANSPDCSNCERRWRDDDAWHTLLECPVFQLYWEDAMTTLQEMGEQPLKPHPHLYANAKTHAKHIMWTCRRTAFSFIRLCGVCSANKRMLTIWSRYIKEKYIRNHTDVEVHSFGQPTND